MAGTNAFVSFDYEDYGKFDFSKMPKGALLKLTCNPFNGLVTLAYQENEVALVVADDILRQIFDGMIQRDLSFFIDECRLSSSVSSFDRCPFCGGVPSYLPDSPVPLRESQSGLFPGHIVCCNGRTVINGFQTRFAAVEFWNGDTGKVA